MFPRQKGRAFSAAEGKKGHLQKEQFGHGYKRMRDFRRVFLITLKQVQVVYREARFTTDGKGMRLFHSCPPVLRRSVSRA